MVVEQGYFQMNRFNKTSGGRMQWLVSFVALVLVAAIGYIDYATPWELSLFLVYSVPIALVVWNLGWRAGLAIALFCAAAWWLAHIESHPYPSDIGFALAVFSRLLYFVVLVVAIAALKNMRQQGLAKIERLERAQILERRILQANEREQQRIGRDLHDSLGPHLAAIGYAASFLADGLRLRNQPEADKAEQIRDLIGDALSLTRDLARGICPVEMNGSGLSMALEELSETGARLTGLSVSYVETGDILVDDPEQALHLYRIAQEALNNALKHAHANKITITLSRIGEILRLAVIDNGLGISPSPNGRLSMGLDSMRYRARMLGGDIKIDSILREGTNVSCEIPCSSLLVATPST